MSEEEFSRDTSVYFSARFGDVPDALLSAMTKLAKMTQEQQAEFIRKSRHQKTVWSLSGWKGKSE